MSSRVLTPDVVGIDALWYTITKPFWQKLKGGVVAVFANNAPAFLCRHACTLG